MAAYNSEYAKARREEAKMLLPCVVCKHQTYFDRMVGKWRHVVTAGHIHDAEPDTSCGKAVREITRKARAERQRKESADGARMV